MKKNILFVVAVFAFGFANAQSVRYGVAVGIDMATAKASLMGVSVSTSETGIYFGGFADIKASNKFHIQPEVLYVAVSDLKQVQIPILAKYAVADKFNLLAGPTLSFLTNPGEGSKSFNYGFDLGASYDITNEFLLEARYDIGLANLNDDPTYSDVKLTMSGFFIGMGYRF